MGIWKEGIKQMSDEEMRILLEKYPFLEYRNVFSGELTYETEEERLKHNWWTVWNNHGWEKIWKKYLSVLFEEYDKMSDEAKKGFMIMDTKEKYGTLRVSTSYGTDKMLEAENILFMMSEWTCSRCGKMPRTSNGNRIIWETRGYICPYCKNCVKKEMKGKDETLRQVNRYVKDLRIENDGFILKHHDKNGTFKYIYKDLSDWLKLDKIEQIKKG